MGSRSRTVATLFLSGILLFSTACSSDGTPSGSGNGVEASVLQTYTTDEYQITVPKAWTVVKKNEFTSDVPQNAVIVFQANRKNEVFLTNVNIVKNTLSQSISSLDYGKIVLANQKNILQNFIEKGHDEVTTSIKDSEQKVIITKFEGKRTTTDPLITFVQTYYVFDRTAYIVTAAYASSEDPEVQKEADNIVQSFSIR